MTAWHHDLSIKCMIASNICIHACILEIIITDVPDDGLCMNALNNKKNISIKIVKIKLSLIYIDTNKDFVENHFKKFFY